MRPRTAADRTRLEAHWWPTWIGAIAVAMVAAAAAFGGEGWMQFRGPGGSAKSAETGLPLRWSASSGIAWQIDLPGAGASCPIVVAGRIYLACYQGYGMPDRREGEGVMSRLRRWLLCMDRKDGRTIWQRELKVKLPEQPRPRDNHGYVSSTPASDGKSIYVFCGKSGVLAFDLDGRELWQADVGSGLSGWGSAASPVLFGELVIVNASVESKSLVALDKKTGKRVWQADGIKEA